MIHLRNPSLELSWLPLSDRKGLPTPQIVFVDMDDCAGCYMMRGTRWDDLEHTGSHDTLAISTHWGSVRQSVIAHEFRHMMQHYVTALPRLMLAPRIDFSRDWAASIKRFYWTRDWEMDALRYQRKIETDDDTEAQWEAVIA